MMNRNYIYEETFRIRSSEVDPGGKAKLQAICDLLQETAGDHALQLNFDISQLQKQNLTWVLHRLHVQMDRYPEWREEINIKTWPSSGDTLRAFRDFTITDATGKEMGRALSYWLILNIESRRPARMPREILQMAPNDVEHVLPVKKERLSGIDHVETSKTFSIRRSDLDMNHHVNNVRYVEWALEALPREQPVKELDIEFHAECTFGDTIKSELNHSGNSGPCIHQIRRKQDQKIVALARTS